MSSQLYWNLPDMRKYKTPRKIAEAVYNLNMERADKWFREEILPAYRNSKRAPKSAIDFFERAFVKEYPGETNKQMVERVLNSNLFTTKQERYEQNVIQMLRNSKVFDDFRRQTGSWNTKITNANFEYVDMGEGLGFFIFYGADGHRWEINVANDYFAEDGITWELMD